MNVKYANRKKGTEEIIYPLHLNSLLENTYGTILYQEQVMKMGQIVAGFDDNQADTYLRKAISKKKKDKLELCKQWLIWGKINKEPPKDYDENNKEQIYYDSKAKHGSEIDGGLQRGYNLKELLDFWEDLQGYVKYLFNKSHASTYSLISCVTAYLKFYYPKEFFCSCMSIQKKDKDKNKQPYIYLYISLLEKEYNIKTLPPNINESDIDFKPSKDKDEVLYGIGCIKGVGPKIISEIINNRPYNSLEDFLSKFPKSKVNKKCAESLILSGCFDELEKCKNRYSILNKFYILRDQKEYLVEEYKWNKQKCIEEEINRLNISLTYKTWIESIKIGDTETFECKMISKTEKIDRNQRLMAFIKVESNNCNVELIAFATKYRKFLDVFDEKINKGKSLTIKAKKLEENKMELITASINNY